METNIRYKHAAQFALKHGANAAWVILGAGLDRQLFFEAIQQAKKEKLDSLPKPVRKTQY